MTKLEFFKMHGLGNDFIVIDRLAGGQPPAADALQRLAHRRTGIGCDQVLLVEPATDANADFGYRVFNADGSAAGQCGNGIRCIARWLRDHGHTSADEIRLEGPNGIVVTRIDEDGLVAVDMGPPRLDPESVPFSAEHRADVYDLQLDGAPQRVGVVSMGNPHLVLEVADVRRAPVAEMGPRLECHPRFPDRANVGFMEIVTRSHIRLRVFERGAGETLACGTGACAAVVVGRLWERLDEEVAVDLPGGRLMISWTGADDAPVWMTGPAVEVFRGETVGDEP